MKAQKKINLPVAIKTPEKMEAATALTVRACEIAFPKGVDTLGQKANFLHAYSVEASKRSTGAAILAGWVLAVARSTCAHGQWMDWLEKNVSFGRTTAANYLSLYAQTLGAQRAAKKWPVALEVPPSAEELEAAAHDVDGKSLSALYKSTRLMAANPNHGGVREGAGCKVKGDEDAAAEEVVALDEIAQNGATAWALVRDHLRALADVERERQVFSRLEFEALAEATSILRRLCKAAEAALQKSHNKMIQGGAK